MAYKLGKTPARKDSVTFKLAKYLPTVAVPAKAGHQALVLDWEGMLGNDQYGDCVWAGAGHETILWGKEGKLTNSFTADTALSDYSAVTGFNKNDPNSDQGTDMQKAASYRRATGIVDVHNRRHKVSAYLAVAPKSVQEIKQAVYALSAVGLGIEFPDSAMDQFNKGEPWTVVKGSKVDGGHYVPVVGYDAQYLYVITWGKVQKMAWAFYEKYNDETVAYLDEEFLVKGKSPEGFDVAQLTADLKALK